MSSEKAVTLEQRTDIPEASRDLPADELYVRLGCRGCEHAVSFVAKGTSSSEPRSSAKSDDTGDLLDLVDAVEIKSLAVQDYGTPHADIMDRLCHKVDGVCFQAAAVEDIVYLLNDRFDANLALPTSE